MMNCFNFYRFYIFEDILLNSEYFLENFNINYIKYKLN